MLLHHQKHHQAYVTGFNKALEQLTTASDPRAIVALQFCH
jgi:superoxide dismutase